MVFVCAAENETKEKLGELKKLVKEIEAKMTVSVCCRPETPPPCHPNPPHDPAGCCQCCCPAFNNRNQPAKPPCPPKPPDVMVCYKVPKASRRADKRVKKSKSKELRASFLHIGCDCEKRNGLQDDCQRSGCHGSPECLTKPEPICGPSEVAGGKHLGRNTYNWNRESIGDGNGITAPYKCYPAKGVTPEDC